MHAAVAWTCIMCVYYTQPLVFSKVHLTSPYMHAHIYINCIHF